MFYSLKTYGNEFCFVNLDKSGFSQTNGYFTFYSAFDETYVQKTSVFFISKAYLRSYFANLGSMQRGLRSGFFKVLHVKGIGFKSFYSPLKHSLYFNLGYNHLTKYKLPLVVKVRLLRGYMILFSFNKQMLFQIIYEIRRLRYPDPYRGKGIRYRFQVIKFKPGKQR